MGRVSQATAENPALAWTFTRKSNAILILTDGTAVLGLGDIRPFAAPPVVEGKSLLFMEFGNIDCVLICLDTTDVDEIVDTVARIAPAYGGINLEDISAPRCFEIERPPKERLDIPVFHDDQHGTAVVDGVVRDARRRRIARIGGGAATIRVALAAGLVEEIQVAVVPALLGAGERLWDAGGAWPSGYALAEREVSDDVTHYRFQRA